MKKFFFTLTAVLAVAAAAYSVWLRHRENQRVIITFYAMDTPMTITAYGPDAEPGIAAARARVKDLERQLSVTDAESAVARLNATGAAESLPDDTARLAAFALSLSRETGRAFDPTLYPLQRAWGFTTDAHRVPSPSELAGLLKLTGPDKVSLSGSSARLAPGTMLDFGALGKGFAACEAAEALRQAGVSAAVLNLGGNVQTLGVRPDGKPWKVGIRSPKGVGLIGVLEADTGAVVTSGGYQRFFIENGVTYWHILDPATGAPARSGVTSATVVGPEGTLCDGLSTAFFVMGAERAAEYYRAHDGFDFILLTDEDELWITDGVASRFTLDSAFHDLKVVPVRR